MTLLSQILRFGVVGTIGFAIDGGVLVGLIEIGMNPFVARLISFPTAVVVTWWLNRIWTFKAIHAGTVGGQVSGYFGVQLVGVCVNYAAYAAVLAVLDATSLNALAALAVGSALGMFVNFFGAKYVVFAPSAPDVASKKD